MAKKYDVSVSYASQRRDYVTTFVRELEKLGNRVFFDQNPDCQARLLGEDLTVELDNIYRKGSNYCVMFICEHYATRPWTRYEQLVLRARRFSDTRTSVLPCRFDKTELPGLQPTIGFVDVSNMQPRDLASLIHMKLNGHRSFDFKPFYTLHAQGEYQSAISYLSAIYNRYYADLSKKKRIWLTYNLACSHSRLAHAMKSDSQLEIALGFLEKWLGDIAAYGVQRYADCLEQFNADDDLLHLRTVRKSEIQQLVMQFRQSFKPNTNPTGQSISHGCFPQGTLVSTPTGPKDISQLTPGDAVLSYDRTRNEIIATKVLAVSQFTADQLMAVNGIITTPTQPFFVTDRGFVQASEIRVGDRLLTETGISSVDSISRPTGGKATVRSVETDHESHNYFAGGVLVHNKLLLSLLSRLQEEDEEQKRK